MTRIYEALKQVESEAKARSGVIDFPGAAEQETQNAQVSQKMRTLARAIYEQVPEPRGKVVQFLGVRGGVGTSRTLRAFAQTCSRRLKRSVLIVCADRDASQCMHYSVSPANSWVDVLHRQSQPDSALVKIPQAGVSLIKAFDESQSTAALLDAPALNAHLDRLRSTFDLILVDSAPADESSDGIELSTIADASILVVEAEKTRWQVAQSVKNSLVARGANVMGVLLNGVKFHIPQAVYGRL